MSHFDRLAQGAAEYGAATGAASALTSGGGGIMDKLPVDVLANPVVIAIGVLTLLIILGLWRTRRYRL